MEILNLWVVPQLIKLIIYINNTTEDTQLGYEAHVASSYT